jgi:predicted transcriptional regulator
MKYPVLDTNKEVVMMLIGTISASIGLVVSTITGSKPDDINNLKADLDKKNHQIEQLVAAKDNLEHMIIDLQKQILENQDNVMDKIILKAALDFDDREAAYKALKK